MFLGNTAMMDRYPALNLLQWNPPVVFIKPKVKRKIRTPNLNQDATSNFKDLFTASIQSKPSGLQHTSKGKRSQKYHPKRPVRLQKEPQTQKGTKKPQAQESNLDLPPLYRARVRILDFRAIGIPGCHQPCYRCTNLSFFSFVVVRVVIICLYR